MSISTPPDFAKVEIFSTFVNKQEEGGSFFVKRQDGPNLTKQAMITLQEMAVFHS